MPATWRFFNSSSLRHVALSSLSRSGLCWALSSTSWACAYWSFQPVLAYPTEITMSDNASEFEYTGTDNLEVMTEAVNYNRFLVDLVETYGARANATLDFGAGIGTFSEMVRERGRSVDCLEMDPRLGDVLQGKGFKNFLRSEDIADASYDYIYSLNVFEHIKDDHAAAREAHRILRPGGTLFIYVPAFAILFGSMDRKVEHFRRYTTS